MRLRGASPKAILAAILIVGFIVTLPLWLASTPEQKQQLTQTTTTLHMVEKNVGILDMQPNEQAQLRRMLKPSVEKEQTSFEQKVWLKDIQRVIKPWINDPTEAETLARWVYIYSQRFDLSPELILSVIAVESQFDHFAISNVGARGLMQVMPFWKEKLGSKDDNLFEIETNIRYGCAILSMYKKRYGKLSRALAAYNGSLGDKKYPARVYARMKRFKASAADL